MRPSNKICVDGSQDENHRVRDCKKCRAFKSMLWRLSQKGKKHTNKRNKELKKHRGYKAKAEVYKAVRKGLLPRVNTLTCVDCGLPATCYDHRDYSKPLEVDPVCKSCNFLRGPAISL